MEKVRVGVVGCGMISTIYLKNMTTVFGGILEVVSCADIVDGRALEAAGKCQGVRAVSVDELIDDDSIELVVNLTIPKAHAEIAMRAIGSGKHIYNEKPLTIMPIEARKLLSAAQKKGLLVGSAPDTFMGAGYQTCRELIDNDVVGRPVAASACMLCRGHERWHPAPEFYYQIGGGPMMDMGSYYLTALISLLGPVSRVTGSTTASFPTRTITSQPLAGKVVPVEVPTHISGILNFACGAVATITTSFDVWHTQAPKMELHGTKASLVMPDPNTFGGPIYLRQSDQKDWQEVKVSRPYVENSRGLGIADMARAIRTGRGHRASGQMAYHVLDLMHAINDSSARGRHFQMETTCSQPAAMGQGLSID